MDASGSQERLPLQPYRGSKVHGHLQREPFAEDPSGQRASSEVSRISGNGRREAAREIAFYSQRAGNDDLWIVSAEDGETRRLTTDRHNDSEPRYSPDGRFIAFLSDRTGEPCPWLLPLGGEKRYLSRTSQPQSWLGRQTEKPCTSRVERARDILRVSRRVVDLAGRPGKAGQFALEVGHEHIYFIWDEEIGDIWVMDVVRELWPAAPQSRESAGSEDRRTRQRLSIPYRRCPP